MAKKKTTHKSDFNIKNKPSNADEVVERIQEKYKDKGIIMKLGGGTHINDERAPTGLLALDVNIGGGIVKGPSGRVMELYGPESSGKTALNLHLIGVMQWMGRMGIGSGTGIAAFVDAEHTLDPVWAAKLGVDINELLVSQPSSGEQALEVTESLMRSKVDFITVDSVAALVPLAEIEGDMGASHMGLHARLMSQALRKLTSVETDSIVSFINQIRMKIGVMFGSPETTTGGNALKFYSSLRLDTRRGDILGDEEEPSGIGMNIKVVKNKTAPPFRKIRDKGVILKYDRGVDVMASYWWCVKKYLPDVITKAGTWYSYGDKKLGQGDDKVMNFLLHNEDIALSILNDLHVVNPTFDLDFYKKYIPYKFEHYREIEEEESDEETEENVDMDTGEIIDHLPTADKLVEDVKKK